MKTSVIVASALLAVGVASIRSTDHGRPAGDAGPPGAAASAMAPSPCRDAVWPYLPAECGAHGAIRPVRIVPAALGR